MRGPSSQKEQILLRWWVRVCQWSWKFLSFVLGTLLLGLLANWLFSAQNVNIHTLQIGAVLDWLNQHSPLIALISIALVILIGITWVGSRQGEPKHVNRHAASAASEHNRIALIRLLSNEYRRQLAQSLQGAVKIELELQERLDAIHSPAEFLSWRLNVPGKRALSAHSSIVEAYDEAGQGLLLLGAPGSGKSTLLRELAIELLTRAEQNVTQPIPVLVNLSIWADKKLPLATWLVDQLRLVYGIPSRLSQGWIEQDQILFLLDGLDEVAPSARTTCIEHINAYRGEHFAPLIVCSRSQEYLMQEQELVLPYAVEVQPLKPEQVDDYLKQIGKPLSAVRTVLRKNTVLHDLVTTPLMLSVMMLTYHGKTIRDLPPLGSAAEQQQQVFEHYVTHMLEQRTRKRLYTSQQTQEGLTWLAQHMKQHLLTEFYLERLQPSWLETERSQTIYRFLSGLILGLVGAPLGWFLGLPLISQIIRLPFYISQSPHNLIFIWQVRDFVWQLGAPFFALLGWLICGLSFGLRSKVIRPKEVLRWSSERFWRGLLFWLVCGPCIWLLNQLIWLFGWHYHWHFIWQFDQPLRMLVGTQFAALLGWLACGLLTGLITGLYLGLSGEQITEDHRIKPNQGIQGSGWNAIRIGFISMLIFGLIFGLIIDPNYLGFFSSLDGLIVGAFIGLIFGLIFGGTVYLKHYLLRFLLWRKGTIPWRYVLFLEDASENVLLQRVGGGYRFIHPLFLDYFASLKTTSSSMKGVEQTIQAPPLPETV